ncbi:hypothetical protein MY5147_004612, partial [Beauveria neobassiana]
MAARISTSAGLICRRTAATHTASCPRRPRLFSTSRGPSVDKVTDADIATLARQTQHPLSLADLVKHGRPPLSERSLLSSANFTLSLLPIRLAHRIQALRNLPYIVVSNPNVARIYRNYLHSLSILLPYHRAAVAAGGGTGTGTDTGRRDAIVTPG